MRKKFLLPILFLFSIVSYGQNSGTIPTSSTPFPLWENVGEVKNFAKNSGLIFSEIRKNPPTDTWFYASPNTYEKAFFSINTEIGLCYQVLLRIIAEKKPDLIKAFNNNKNMKKGDKPNTWLSLDNLIKTEIVSGDGMVLLVISAQNIIPK